MFSIYGYSPDRQCPHLGGPCRSRPLEMQISIISARQGFQFRQRVAVRIAGQCCDSQSRYTLGCNRPTAKTMCVWYRAGLTVLIDLLVHHVPMAVLCERWALSSSCLYDWQRAFLLHGMESSHYRQSGGRRPTLTPRQKKRLVELLEAGPQVVGVRPPVGPLASSAC